MNSAVHGNRFLPMTRFSPAARATLLPLLLMLAAAVPAGAQRVRTVDQNDWRRDVWAPPPRAPSAIQRSGASPLHIAVFTTGGGLLGGWMGFFASQVVRSDWQNEPGRREMRTRYSVIGAGVGLLAGFVIGHHSSVKPAPGLLTPGPAPGPGDAPITAEQIRASSARSIRELLREVRPRWLRSRGLDVIHESNEVARPRGVQVYLNNGLLGGLDTLDEVSIDTVTEIRFLDAAAATLRWGVGNEDGAILLSTRLAR